MKGCCYAILLSSAKKKLMYYHLKIICYIRKLNYSRLQKKFHEFRDKFTNVCEHFANVHKQYANVFVCTLLCDTFLTPRANKIILDNTAWQAYMLRDHYKVLLTHELMTCKLARELVFFCSTKISSVETLLAKELVTDNCQQ